MAKKTEQVEGTELIRQERMRQVAVEKWTAAHDDMHECGDTSRETTQVSEKFPAVTKYITGVYWFRDHAYGGMTETTKGEIEAEREKHKRLGFDKPGVSEIHTIKVTRQRIA